MIKLSVERAKPLVTENSDSLWEKACKVIPGGCQTFSKMPYQHVAGVSPKLLSRGSGCRSFDLDGNEYIDYMMSLGPNILGYADEEINKAAFVGAELGVLSSLGHPLETELAEKLVSIIPCAEMVRFAKNGSDVTSAAVSSVIFGPGALFEGGLAFNPSYGLGVTGLIAIHEYGHVLACKYYGIPSDAPVFTWSGAYVSHTIPKNAYQHAMVALAGPVVGTMGAIGVGAVGLCFDSPVLCDLAGLGIIFNGLNLIPIKPFDGGAIVRAIHPAISVVATGAACVGTMGE